MDRVNQAPVITIDGPSGTGKGTITTLLAKSLGWRVLDSGAIYRAIAWALLQQGQQTCDEEQLLTLLATTQIQLVFEAAGKPVRVYCDDVEVTDVIRSEQVSMFASQISALPFLRKAILQMQRDFRAPPGLIADGRDMGTIVFPDATLKLYLDADPSERVKRRFQQLQQKGADTSLATVEEYLLHRDYQDKNRLVAPLVPAADAQLIDTTGLSIEGVFAKVMAYVHQFVL